MKLHICEKVMFCLRIELEQFTTKFICLLPMRRDDLGRKYWAITDARPYDQPMTELKSCEMTIWAPRKCFAELNGQVMVRGRGGFEIGAWTDALRAEATLFASKDDGDLDGPAM
jgi:hypothetical protein